ncbi:helix-turn-helix domain-containing protein [Rhizobium leguminosarum]|jgi:transcriptional regulator with XRE-family HTH domain|uniref:helix-turn-helix domain-containing protein n=1 Tax=Rhizobium leguminosarum TaxID=384 RepID=UPI001C8FE1FA|nr:helix-turn-helix transcriptional regulator [Rhizobium leguminosarum]MBY2932535.1 helix-turn-helix transcriptional regulator [Rhizobium leguminosarum]
MTATFEQVEYTKERLASMRKSAGLTQAEFSSYMGVRLRTYEDLEGGRSTVRPVHIRAAEMALIYISKNHSVRAIEMPAYLKDVVAQSYANCFIDPPTK